MPVSEPRLSPVQPEVHAFQLSVPASERKKMEHN